MSSSDSTVPHTHLPWRRWRYAPLFPIVLAGLVFAGYWPRHVARMQLVGGAGVAATKAPRVKVAAALPAGRERSLTLPGSLVASSQAAVNARATGYVARWRADIGDRVHAGDVLAELDTPELDQQLEQARATLKQKEGALEQANANLDYAHVAAKREDALLASAISSKELNDQAHAQVKIWDANVHAARADLAAAEASVRELLQLVSFGKVRAPFDGRITQRTIDIGSLVTAGGTSTTLPMFRIEATDPIHVFVQVPQAFALSIKPGQPASIAIRQLPGRAFEGHVVRTAGSLDPLTRTLNVEIEIPNRSGELLGGMYALTTIAVALAHPVVKVPASAVITDARGIHVATVDAGGLVHLLAVQPGPDNGRDIDIVDGLRGGENVVVSPGGDIAEGTRVEAVNEP